MLPIKALMDDHTLTTNKKQFVQKTLDKLDRLLGRCRLAFKPAKFRSIAFVRGEICRDVFFDMTGQRIPTVSEEPVKSLGRVFDESFTDKCMKGMQAIEAAPLQGRFKVWLLVLLHGCSGH